MSTNLEVILERIDAAKQLVERINEIDISAKEIDFSCAAPEEKAEAIEWLSSLKTERGLMKEQLTGMRDSLKVEMAGNLIPTDTIAEMLAPLQLSGDTMDQHRDGNTDAEGQQSLEDLGHYDEDGGRVVVNPVGRKIKYRRSMEQMVAYYLALRNKIEDGKPRKYAKLEDFLILCHKLDSKIKPSAKDMGKSERNAIRAALDMAKTYVQRPDQKGFSEAANALRKQLGWNK